MTKLEKLEAVIEDGLQTFVAVGNALLEIRDSKLYRKEYDTFELYCRDRWRMSKTQANRLIESSEVVGLLTPNGVVPKTEAVARALVPLKNDPDLMQQTFAAVVKVTNGKPTAAKARIAVGIARDTLGNVSPRIEKALAELSDMEAIAAQQEADKGKWDDFPREKWEGILAEGRLVVSLRQACKQIVEHTPAEVRNAMAVFGEHANVSDLDNVFEELTQWLQIMRELRQAIA